MTEPPNDDDADDTRLNTDGGKKRGGAPHKKADEALEEI